MKKNVLVVIITFFVVSLVALVYLNSSVTVDKMDVSASEEVAMNKNAEKANNKNITDTKLGPFKKSDFVFGIASRFGPLKKSDLDKATSITDFLSQKEIDRIVSYKSVEFIVIENDKESDKRVFGTTSDLNTEQLEFIKKIGYSTNLKIRTEYIHKNNKTGEIEDSYSTPHLTIVPEKQAEYIDGINSLIEYLDANTIEARTDLDRDNLKPARLLFTVSKEGKIENIKLDRGSGYPVIDKLIMDSLKDAPGKWIPAETIQGEKVDQELVVLYGTMGC